MANRKIISILAIEDNPPDVVLIRESLRQQSKADPLNYQYKLYSTTHLGAGIKLAHKEEISIVLLDLSLPDYQGEATLRTALKAMPDLPIIIISGNEDENLAIKMVRSGAQDYLLKYHLNGDLLVRSILYAIERKEARTALLETERQLKALHDNTLEGIFRTTADGILLYVNPAMARIFRYRSIEELMGVNIKELFFRPQDRDKVLRKHTRADNIKDLEYRMKRQDGSEVWVRENTIVRHDDQGQVKWYEGFLSDITERRILESEIIKTQRLESVRILAEGLAHDFNNFLMEIQLNATSARLLALAHPIIQERLREIEKSVTRAKGLTQQFRSFATEAQPARTRTDLSGILMESVKFAVRGTSVTPVFDLEPDLWTVNVNIGQINQVISNLVINARNAMRDEGSLQVTAANQEVNERDLLGALSPGRYIRVSIQDQGAGIDPTIIDKIFEPYFTTRTAGSGLGLYSCFRIVDQHDGWITAASTPDQGSIFTFYLPADELLSAEPYPAQLSTVAAPG